MKTTIRRSLFVGIVLGMMLLLKEPVALLLLLVTNDIH